MLKFDNAHSAGFGCWSCLFNLRYDFVVYFHRGAAGWSPVFDGTMTCHSISVTVH